METNYICITTPGKEFESAAGDIAAALEPLGTAEIRCDEESDLDLGAHEILITILTVAVTRPIVDLAFKQVARTLRRLEINVKLTVELKAGKRRVVRTLHMKSKNLWDQIIEEVKKEVFN